MHNVESPLSHTHATPTATPTSIPRNLIPSIPRNLVPGNPPQSLHGEYRVPHSLTISPAPFISALRKTTRHQQPNSTADTQGGYYSPRPPPTATGLSHPCCPAVSLASRSDVSPGQVVLWSRTEVLVVLSWRCNACNPCNAWDAISPGYEIYTNAAFPHAPRREGGGRALQPVAIYLYRGRGTYSVTSILNPPSPLSARSRLG